MGEGGLLICPDSAPAEAGLVDDDSAVADSSVDDALSDDAADGD
jgi:hypothetical protein